MKNRRGSRPVAKRPVFPPASGGSPEASLPGAGPAQRSVTRARWLLASIALHALVLGALLVWRTSSPGPEPEPVPVALIEPEPPKPPEPPRRRLRFRAEKRVRPLERLEFPQESPALAPPPPDVPLTREASGGGTAVAVSVPSVFAGYTLAGEGGGSAGEGFGAGNASALGGSSFAEYLGRLREVGLDVVFVIDATGTMGPVIEEVKGDLEALTGTIRRLVPVTRFGIVAYRDEGAPGFVTRVQPLTLSVRKLRRFLHELRAEGGGDFPEAVEAGIRDAIDRAGWSPDSRWVVVLVGDAPPHADRMDETLALVQAFHERGGTVTALDVSLDANPKLAAERLGVAVQDLTTLGRSGVRPEFRAIARAGGGDAATLDGHVRVVGRLAMLVFGDDYAEEVRPLLGDL